MGYKVLLIIFLTAKKPIRQLQNGRDAAPEKDPG